MYWLEAKRATNAELVKEARHEDRLGMAGYSDQVLVHLRDGTSKMFHGNATAEMWIRANHDKVRR